MNILGSAGIPCCAIYDTLDVFNDNHLKERDFIQEFNQDDKDYKILGQPFKLSESKVDIELASSLGEQSKDILRDILKLDESAIEELFDSKAIQ
jgi:crotonobetainyl-CoA:carnitine CoA-transferase CaiB-like acyl-CoA transferase